MVNGNGQAIKLVRRNKTTGVVEARRQGRPHPDFENGYLDVSGQFVAGNPFKEKRKVGRPKRTEVVQLHGSGIGEIEAIIQREVQTRLNAAKEAAIKTFQQTLG